jgi:hypothetical protein
MATVSFCIPDELKEKMDEHDEINWGAVLRSNIEDELDRLESRDVAHAVAASERLSGEIIARTWLKIVRPKPSASGERCDTGPVRTMAEIIVDTSVVVSWYIRTASRTGPCAP